MNELGRGICFPLGFKASGIAGGIKPSGRLDTAIITSERPAAAAAVFTTNRVRAASVIVSMKHFGLTKEQRAVILTAGNANAATGPEGIKTAELMCSLLAEKLCIPTEQVLIAQTGLIGKTLRRDVALSAIEKAHMRLSQSGGIDAGQAILTTDTKAKICERSYKIGDNTIRLGAVAKGAAMLSPSLATMLATVTSDVAIQPELLQAALNEAVSDSFHLLIVDGCRSTNDSVFVLTNGASDSATITAASSNAYKLFSTALTAVLQDLAMQMASDAEGSTKLMTVHVTGALTCNDARLAARAVVSSLLVKCSIAGGIAYWGRILSELGASGAEFNQDDVAIYYGPHLLSKNGVAFPADEDAVQEYMKNRTIEITANIGQGAHDATAYGCDLTHAYVAENMTKS